MKKSLNYLLIALSVFAVSCNKTEKDTNEVVLPTEPLHEVVDSVKVEANEAIAEDSIKQVEIEEEIEKSVSSQVKKSNCKKQNKKVVIKKEEVAKVDSVVIEEINISGKIYNISPNKDSLSWNDAKIYCDTLTLEGIDDWYLPEVSEVSAIFKNKGELSNIKTEDYWTNNENYLSALVVYFGTGQTFYFDKVYRCNVRCVRKK